MSARGSADNTERLELLHSARRHVKNEAVTRGGTGNAPLPADAAETQLDGFIVKFDERNQVLIREVRAALRDRLAGANELVYDNYNLFVIGYCSTLRPSDCVVSIAADANGVALSFYYGSTLPDPQGLLLGTGRQNRFLRLESAEMLMRPAVEALISAALSQAETPMLENASGKLVIRSVSAKQRPRQRSR